MGLFVLLGIGMVGGFMVKIFSEKTSIEATHAILVYKYGDNKNINEQLSNDDAQIIKTILDNKKLYKDNPSCGFSPDISIKYGDLTFSIARDKCPILKLVNTDKYIKITESERKKIEKVFNKYGATFPAL